jgi:hypothetical protein
MSTARLSVEERDIVRLVRAFVDDEVRRSPSSPRNSRAGG